MNSSTGLGIEETLRPALRDRSVRFVFPSRICAEAWLAESLRTGVSAIEADRFLGWDSLRDETVRSGGKPAADDYVRRIFAAKLLGENASKPFLSTVVPPAHAELWQPFSGYLASRLPRLGRLPDALRDAGLSASDRPAAADWLAVRGRYEDFLTGVGLFEPSYEPRCLRELEGRTVIFFPELIEDFEEYAQVLEAAPSVRIVRLPGAPKPIPLSRPETALAELRQTLSEIGELLDRGAEAEGMAITVASLREYRPYLEREATLLSIPLDIRSGSTLAATSGGRLFCALRDAYSSGFAYDSLRDLLLSPAWPWKDPDVGHRILAEGLRLHAVAPWTEGGRKVDVWELSLEGGLKSAYRELKTKITNMTQADDFRSLLIAYNAFKTRFLSQDREDWEAGVDLTLASCVKELQGLARAQERSGLEVGQPFTLFMQVLDSKIYVSRGTLPGVPVYEWRVAAGICPERHFVLGASQDALAVPNRGFDFLGESLREELGAPRRRGAFVPESDAGAAFIAAYALSGASVSFSCPAEGFVGSQAAHGFLVSLAEEEASDRPTDRAYRDEAAWLAGRGPPPSRLYPAQALGLASAARAGSAPDGADDVHATVLIEGAGRPGGPVLERETTALATRRLYREGDPRVRIDSTSIDAYRACPYAYLYLRLLDAGPQSSGIAFVDSFFIGDVYHAALAALFARVKNEDGRFKPERESAYEGLVEPCLGEAFAELARKHGPFVRVALEAYRGKLSLYLRNLVAIEAERFPSLEVLSIEGELEREYPEVAGGTLLRGRVDRISRSERGAVVIDYKKGYYPAKSEVAPDEGGTIAKAQIPCYLSLVAEAGLAIDSAWYVSIEGDSKRRAGEAACAFGDAKSAYVRREDLASFLEAFDAALREAVEGILGGAFPLAPKDSQKLACADCGARGICRERYALRFRAEGRA